MCDCEKGRKKPWRRESHDSDSDSDSSSGSWNSYDGHRKHGRHHKYNRYRKHDCNRRCEIYCEPRLSNFAYWPQYNVNPRYYAY